MGACVCVMVGAGVHVGWWVHVCVVLGVGVCDAEYSCVMRGAGVCDDECSYISITNYYWCSPLVCCYTDSIPAYIAYFHVRFHLQARFLLLGGAGVCGIGCMCM
jgi:hypothetical protein